VPMAGFAGLAAGGRLLLFKSSIPEPRRPEMRQRKAGQARPAHSAARVAGRLAGTASWRIKAESAARDRSW